MDLNKIQSLHQASETRIVMRVIDGLGGLPRAKNSMTELETAHTPNMDALAAKSICGLHVPVGNGITPGKGVLLSAWLGCIRLRQRKCRMRKQSLRFFDINTSF